MNFWIVSPVSVYCDIHFKTLNSIFAIRYIFPLVLRDDWQLVVSCLSGSMMSSCESTRWMYGTWPTAELSRLWRRLARWFASMSVEENLCVKKWWRSSWWKDPKVPVSELKVSWWKRLLWYCSGPEVNPSGLLTHSDKNVTHVTSQNMLLHVLLILVLPRCKC